MKQITIEDLAGQERQIIIDFDYLEQSGKVSDRRLWTYLMSYPYIIGFFANVEEITPHELILGNAMVFSLMPTTMNLRNDDIEPLLLPLTKLKNKGTLLTEEEFIMLKKLINNSLTATSKLLHFINPHIYPIWDSRINRFLSSSTKNTNSVKTYYSYLDNYQLLAKNDDLNKITYALSQKLNYKITNARAFDLILYLSDLYQLDLMPSKLSKAYPDSKEKKTKPILPIYKRDAFIFISNLKEVTADPLNPHTLKREGYLLSEHYTTKSSIERALWVRSRRNLLISDNGNWTRMSQIAKKFTSQGQAILNKAKEELETTNKISAPTLSERKELITLIAETCQECTQELDIHSIIETQLAINPHYLIGMEDFTIPVMTMCGMLDKTFNPTTQEISTYQQRTAQLFTDQINGRFGFDEKLKTTYNFMVLHAYDYNSAFSGAQLTKETLKDGVAISYGAPMRSRRWITEIQFNNSTEQLGEKLPEPYLIAQAMTLGVVNGYKDDTPVHILGVGSPIMMVLIGYLLRQSKAVSIDSTAPFKDAYAGTIYGSRHAFLKMDMYKVAASALINKGSYNSTTPFFKSFEEKYPSNWQGLRKRLKVTKDSDIKKLAIQLEENQDLVRQYIPFFTRMKGGDDPFIWDLRIARSGHNYWIIKSICEDIRQLKDNPQKLKEWIVKQISNYQLWGNDKWAKAVKLSFSLTEKHRI